MTTQDDGFLSDILANPNEDGLRLIYADWLEEHDNPRGTFIRLQMELNELPITSPKRKDIQQTLRALFDLHNGKWGKALRGAPAALQFRRGFADYAQMSVETFLKQSEEVFAIAPITGLCLFNGGSEDLQKAFEDPRMSQIQRLVLEECRGRSAVARAIATSENFSRLKFLDCSSQGMSIGPVGSGAIAKSKNLPTLTGLNVTHNQIRSAGFQKLAESNRLKLHHLDVCGNKLKLEDMDYFGSSEAFADLHTLCLWYNQLGDAGIKQFLDKARLPRLRRLNLNNNQITYRGAKALAESPLLSQLDELQLSYNDQLDEKAALALVERLEEEEHLWINLYAYQGVEKKARQRLTDRAGDRLSFSDGDRWRTDEEGWFWYPDTKQSPR